MKLEIARGVFLASALTVASLCGAAWSEPTANVIHSSESRDFCPLPAAAARAQQLALQPDGDLLLLLYGLSQSLGGRG
ncbi:hypothetical protein DP64_10310 [Stutzerimonas degradans]|nr:hypothetical protein DP64_10310 [Stutzerimonas degradans]